MQERQEVDVLPNRIRLRVTPARVVVGVPEDRRSTFRSGTAHDTRPRNDGWSASPEPIDTYQTRTFLL
ncbi:hypothetical protein HNY73_021715 [Argiope bruennichi]|uniref:Uncharacterized protein n=1 Tax=Argiope bruennichi TaxID=94029 RepID=A0A8T0E0C2_ARGBR|nr:hypothetical protein HNY73_021715 [Argiope bruennichi]